MLKVFAILGAVLLAAVAIVAVLAAGKPDEFRVARQTVIQAPPEKIYPLIADLHRWAEWSPYEKKDPDMRRTFSGPQSGVGAAYAWEGDKTVGAGRMQIASVEEPSEGGPSKVVIALEFSAPFDSKSTAEFAIVPLASGSAVTWSMHGPNQFIGKVMSLFFDIDKMVGADFAAGLADLKSIVEKPGAEK